MDIFIGSDLHLEFGRGNLKVPKGDILILAGDVFTPWVNKSEIRTNLKQKINKRFLKFFAECNSNFRNVIFVPGNHEYYHGEFSETNDRCKEYFSDNKFNNFVFLQNQTFEYEFLTFFGSTFWTDYNGGNPLMMEVATNGMEDFNLVYDEGEPVSIHTIFKANQVARNHLLNFLEKDFTNRLPFIVTHHAPTWESVQGISRTSLLSYAYANTRLDYPLADFQHPSYWVHGHMHDPCKYEVGKCNVVCNPRGYYGIEPMGKIDSYKFFKLEI